MFQQTKLPRWRGFNLMGMFMKSSCPGHFDEEDFQLISDWGFNFVRLPLSYLFWIQDGDEWKIDESKLEEVDKAVRWGETYGIHVNISFHRGPGYCVNDEHVERFNLWEDQEALDCFLHHWTLFAKRYRSQPLDKVSYNLLNEPFNVSPEAHGRVMRKTVQAIHAVDPGRTILLDGLGGGNYPMVDLGDLAKDNVGQSCRGYIPSGISHYRASWVDTASSFPYPTWPGGKDGAQVWTRERLDAHYRAWAAMAQAQGVGVHCGEGGSNRNCPHEIALRWLDDLLCILKSYNIGYAQWNFTGDFGVLDSGRRDVAYEEYKGHLLDRQMLDILRKY